MTAMLITSFGGKRNKELIIGNQIWMDENLNVDKFKNNDTIPQAKNTEEWVKAIREGKPAWCYYDNDPKNGENGAKYGRLYNWYAIYDPRGLSPEGWRIPSDRDWTVLTNYLGGEDIAATKLKSTKGWDYDGNGADDYGFSALPGGRRDLDGSGTTTYFTNLGSNGHWWSATELGANNAWSRFMYYNSNNVTRYGRYSIKSFGFSVRCVRDEV